VGSKLPIYGLLPICKRSEHMKDMGLQPYIRPVGGHCAEPWPRMVQSHAVISITLTASTGPVGTSDYHRIGLTCSAMSASRYAKPG